MYSIAHESGYSLIVVRTFVLFFYKILQTQKPRETLFVAFKWDQHKSIALHCIVITSINSSIYGAELGDKKNEDIAIRRCNSVVYIHSVCKRGFVFRVSIPWQYR